MANETCAISVIIGVFVYDNDYAYLVALGFIFLILYNVYFLMMLFRSLFKGYTLIIDNLIYSKFDTIVKAFQKFPKI